MNEQYGKFIFFDIDGTLLAGGYDKSYLPASTLEALTKLRKAGHFICLATGRSEAMADEWRRRIGVENMVSDGGYGITINDRLIEIEPLDKDKMVNLIRECEKKSIPWALQLDNSTTRVAPNASFSDFTQDSFMRTRIVEDLDPQKCEKIYKAYIGCKHPVEHTLETLKELPFGRYHETYIFVEPSDKARGIRKILKYFGGRNENVIVFGDSPNDLSMFADEWFKVAMGNAHPTLKKKADLITDRVDEDGIFNACKKLNLF